MRGEGVGGGGGQAVNVHILVNRLEKSEVSRKFSKFVKPRGRRGGEERHPSSNTNFEHRIQRGGTQNHGIM